MYEIWNFFTCQCMHAKLFWSQFTLHACDKHVVWVLFQFLALVVTLHDLRYIYVLVVFIPICFVEIKAFLRLCYMLGILMLILFQECYCIYKGWTPLHCFLEKFPKLNWLDALSGSYLTNVHNLYQYLCFFCSRGLRWFK